MYVCAYMYVHVCIYVSATVHMHVHVHDVCAQTCIHNGTVHTRYICVSNSTLCANNTLLPKTQCVLPFQVGLVHCAYAHVHLVHGGMNTAANYVEYSTMNIQLFV